MNLQDIYDEMAALTTDVRREILNSTYPALYLVMFSIMEGNTREKSWIDQQMKTVHVTKENHKMLSDLVKVLIEIVSRIQCSFNVSPGL